jgi:hypothetical protein
MAPEPMPLCSDRHPRAGGSCPIRLRSKGTQAVIGAWLTHERDNALNDLPRSFRRRGSKPRVIAAPREPKGLAKSPDRMIRLLRVDGLAWTHHRPFTKKAIDFFSTSRSAFTA